MKGLLLFVLGAICGAIAMFLMMPPQRSAARVEQARTTATEPVAPQSIPVAATPPADAHAEHAHAASESAADVADAAPEPNALAAASNTSPTPSALLIPVDGVTANQLHDTFDDARAAGRRHDAIDIMAPKGTRVLAVADGKVVKLFTSVRGGLTVYEFDPTETFAYYYAHLDSYAPGVAEGVQLRRGDLVGYVGSSGDANPAAPHLHFAVMVLGPEKHWWEGTAINPYPILAGHQ